MLQDRYCQPRIYDCNRSGRTFSQCIGAPTAGQKEREFLEVVRVDRVEVYEQGSHGRYSEVCPDGYVYNIEVSGYHTYFSNGIAVHNCHHAMARTWRNIIDAYPNAFVVGLTATPQRLGGQGLGDVFESLVIGPTTKELIQQGHLSPYRYYAPPMVADLSGLKTKMGDFESAEVAIRMDRPVVLGNAIEHYKSLAAGKRAIAYCASRLHSENTAAAFNAAGIPAKHIDGETPKAERKQTISDFRADKITVITNVDLISEGFDCPGCEAVILLRPTQSLTLFIQQSMRGMRPDKFNPFKTAIILDHVGNAYRHGLPDDDREWSLEGRKKRKKSDGPAVSIRVCSNCYSVHAPGPVCTICGFMYPIESRVIEEKAGELKEFTPQEKKARRMEVGMCRTQEELTEIAIERGYAKGWVKFRCDAKKIPFSWGQLNRDWVRLNKGEVSLHESK